MRLNEMKTGTPGIIRKINGDERFVSRTESMGLIPGCKVVMLKNEKKQPVLIYARNTMIAIAKEESEKIEIGEEEIGGEAHV